MKKTMKKCLQCGSSNLSLYMGGQFGKYECKRCGYVGVLVFEEEIPSEVPDYYREGFNTWLARLYDVGFKVVFFGFGQKIRNIFLKFIPQKTKKVLDLATGTGAVAITIKKRFPRTKVVGVDLSQVMLSIAKKKAQKQKLQISWIKQNIENAGFKDATFDAVTVSFSLHELPPRHRFNVIKEAYRVLRKSGKFILMDFNRPKNVIFQQLFYLFILIFEESYAKTLLKQDLVKDFKNAGFRAVHKKLYWNELVQVVIGTK